MASDGPKKGREDVFPSNPDLTDILGRADLNFEILFIFWTPNFWISRSPDLQIPRFPGCQISDAAGAAAGRVLRSQLDPSPNAPRDQIRRRALAATSASRDKIRRKKPLLRPRMNGNSQTNTVRNLRNQT